LIRRPGGPPSQLLKEGVEWRALPPLAIGREGPTWDKFFAGVPELLVTPLLRGPVSLISQGRFEEPVRLCALPVTTQRCVAVCSRPMRRHKAEVFASAVSSHCPQFLLVRRPHRASRPRQWPSLFTASRTVKSRSYWHSGHRETGVGVRMVKLYAAVAQNTLNC